MSSIPSILVLAFALQGGAETSVRVDVSGVSGELRRSIRAHLSLVQRQGETDLPESTVRALHQRAPREIREALRPFGYYRPTIRSELLERTAGWVARYRVDPGDPVRYDEVELTLIGAGREDPVLRQALPKLAVREGAVVRHDAWERAKGTLVNQAAGRGYLDVRVVRSRVEVDTTALSARAVLELETGPRYRFGPVRFPTTPFRPSLLRRYVTFSPGEPFDLQALLTMQRALSASDYFRLVQVEPRREQADSLRVPIRVTLETRPRASYTVGAGYGTDTGVRGTAAGRLRWLNARGHRIQGEARASARYQSFSGQYIIPVGGGPANRVAATAVVEHEDFEGLESRSVFARVELDHGRGGWREVVSFRLAEDWFRDGDDVGNSTLLIPEVAWTRVWGDEVVYPRRGFRVELGVRGATAELSDIGFAQATARLSAARGLHPTGRLLARLSVGATRVDDLLALPISLRLYAGGDQTVRGFKYRSLGPVGVDTTVTGGRHQLVGSIEVEQMVIAGFGLAVFTDAGNVFAAGRDISLGGLEQGVGFGLRWRSPIGLVRADIAWPVSRSGEEPRLHFVFGGLL